MTGNLEVRASPIARQGLFTCRAFARGERIPVPAGEELTIDYAPLSPAGWEMRCTCGAPCCRGVVGRTLK